MKYFLIGIALLLSGEVASAQDYTTSQYCSPWCHEGPRSGGLDCSYNNFEQCRASQFGARRKLRPQPVPEPVHAAGG